MRVRATMFQDHPKTMENDNITEMHTKVRLNKEHHAAEAANGMT